MPKYRVHQTGWLGEYGVRPLIRWIQRIGDSVCRHRRRRHSPFQTDDDDDADRGMASLCNFPRITYCNCSHQATALIGSQLLPPFNWLALLVVVPLD